MNSNYRIHVSNETPILKLDSPNATLELVGGKGASLARMVAADLLVPPGFHITTHAYRGFINEKHLAEEILAAAKHGRADDPATLDTPAAQIQSMIIGGTISEDLATLIRRAYSE